MVLFVVRPAPSDSVNSNSVVLASLQGTLFTNFSETPVKGTLAFFAAGKPIPKFKVGPDARVRTVP